MSFLCGFVLNAGRRKERKSEFRCAFVGGYVAGLWGVNVYLNLTNGELVGHYASLSGPAFSLALVICLSSFSIPAIVSTSLDVTIR